jgi:hypothetical protein
MRKIEQPKITTELKTLVDPKNVAGSLPYKVNNFRELVEQVAKLSYLNKDYLLFFRGQGNDYKNRKGNSTFYPSIYRGDYLSQSELNYKFELLNTLSKNLSRIFQEENIEGYREFKRKKLIQWSILQHYEVCSTPLLDFTHSLRVASSFAHMDNENGNAYIFVFGLPYLTNRISNNSEHDLVNIRLLSISPPEALRPYFQEGYLAGTEDITNEYESKSELDFKNRLIAKFEIPNDKIFWGRDFKIIPKNALYPSNDKVLELCNRIKDVSEKELSPGQLGEFLTLWSELEEFILNEVRRRNNRVYNMREAINQLFKMQFLTQDECYQLDRLRKFRNDVVHKPKKITSPIILDFTETLRRTKEEIITRYNNVYKK